MYLRKIYQQHKGWFIFIMIFISAQLFINYKHGVVFSPFYHYGMYSSVINPQAYYGVTEIIVNGKMLQTKDFSPPEWDKIILPISMNNNQEEWNSSIYNNTIKRLLHIKDSSAYVNHYNTSQFQKWYKCYLADIIHEKIDSLEISNKMVSF